MNIFKKLSTLILSIMLILPSHTIATEQNPEQTSQSTRRNKYIIAGVSLATTCMGALAWTLRGGAPKSSTPHIIPTNSTPSQASATLQLSPEQLQQIAIHLHTLNQPCHTPSLIGSFMHGAAQSAGSYLVPGVIASGVMYLIFANKTAGLATQTQLEQTHTSLQRTIDDSTKQLRSEIAETSGKILNKVAECTTELHTKIDHNFNITNGLITSLETKMGTLHAETMHVCNDTHTEVKKIKTGIDTLQAGQAELLAAIQNTPELTSEAICNMRKRQKDTVKRLAAHVAIASGTVIRAQGAGASSSDDSQGTIRLRRDTPAQANDILQLVKAPQSPASSRSNGSRSGSSSY